MRHMQVRQSDACIQAPSLFTAIDMDGVAFMGEVPGLAVDCRGGQSGRFQAGIGCVRDLFHAQYLANRSAYTCMGSP